MPQPATEAQHRVVAHLQVVHLVAHELDRPHERRPLRLMVAPRLALRGPVEPHRHDREGIVRRAPKKDLVHALDQRQMERAAEQ